MELARRFWLFDETGFARNNTSFPRTRVIQEATSLAEFNLSAPTTGPDLRRRIEAPAYPLSRDTVLEWIYARIESRPFQSNAIPWPARLGAIAKPSTISKRLGDIFVEPEAMGFEIRTVGRGGEQMHRDVMRAMARHRKVERLREMRDLHE